MCVFAAMMAPVYCLRPRFSGENRAECWYCAGILFTATIQWRKSIRMLNMAPVYCLRPQFSGRKRLERWIWRRYAVCGHDSVAKIEQNVKYGAGILFTATIQWPKTIRTLNMAPVCCLRPRFSGENRAECWISNCFNCFCSNHPLFSARNHIPFAFYLRLQKHLFSLTDM
jgi:hypothetical protein